MEQINCFFCFRMIFSIFLSACIAIKKFDKTLHILSKVFFKSIGSELGSEKHAFREMLLSEAEWAELGSIFIENTRFNGRNHFSKPDFIRSQHIRFSGNACVYTPLRCAKGDVF